MSVRMRVRVPKGWLELVDLSGWSDVQKLAGGLELLKVRYALVNTKLNTYTIYVSPGDFKTASLVVLDLLGYQPIP